ncbi:hypothetical protein NSK_002096 [Nannochloropsis salina CCMP1776]|uniref:Uncharacterized protein n=1 Tax=Nannochloropsis salina CCMP1776 TaxID=1027361 RepID=A0A4D9DD13_9STRA|nr:hypothetical protein NSK_002096 [Nannochloropsis salina CCMP1776]|eukprot:TFJ86439.1 hypothetical protein NSK_002096 [Nannochloropsis salina CCMP1776]
MSRAIAPSREGKIDAVDGGDGGRKEEGVSGQGFGQEIQDPEESVLLGFAESKRSSVDEDSVYGAESPKPGLASHGLNILRNILHGLQAASSPRHAFPREDAHELYDTLVELGEMEKDLSEYVHLMDRYEERLRVILEQVGALFQEHAVCRQQARRVEEELREEVRMLKRTATGLDAVKAPAVPLSPSFPVAAVARPACLESPLPHPPPRSPGSSSKDTSNYVAALELKEAIIHRKYTLLFQKFAVQAKRLATLEEERRESEIEERGHRLEMEGWRRQALRRLGQYRRWAMRSVPRPEFERVCHELVTVQQAWKAAPVAAAPCPCAIDATRPAPAIALQESTSSAGMIEVPKGTPLLPPPFPNPAAGVAPPPAKTDRWHEPSYAKTWETEEGEGIGEGERDSWEEERMDLLAKLERYQGFEASATQVDEEGTVWLGKRGWRQGELEKWEEDSNAAVIQGLQEQILEYQTRSDEALARAELELELQSARETSKHLARKLAVLGANHRRREQEVKALETTILEMKAGEEENELLTELSLLRTTVQELAVSALWSRRGKEGDVDSISIPKPAATPTVSGPTSSFTAAFCARLKELDLSLRKLVRRAEERKQDITDLEATVGQLRAEKEDLMRVSFDGEPISSGGGKKVAREERGADDTEMEGSQEEERIRERKIVALRGNTVGLVDAGGEDEDHGETTLSQKLGMRLLSVSERLKISEWRLLQAQQELRRLKNERESCEGHEERMARRPVHILHSPCSCCKDDFFPSRCVRSSLCTSAVASPPLPPGEAAEAGSSRMAAQRSPFSDNNSSGERCRVGFKAVQSLLRGFVGDAVRSAAAGGKERGSGGDDKHHKTDHTISRERSHTACLMNDAVQSHVSYTMPRRCTYPLYGEGDTKPRCWQCAQPFNRETGERDNNTVEEQEQGPKGEEEVMQIENLRQANVARSVAEALCAAALEEEKRMRRHMAVLAHQLQSAEERLFWALKGEGLLAASVTRGIRFDGALEEHMEGKREIRMLHRLLEEKDGELNELKRAIWRLREDCIRAIHQEADEAKVEESKLLGKKVAGDAQGSCSGVRTTVAMTRATWATRKRRKSDIGEEKGAVRNCEWEEMEEKELVIDLQEQMTALQQRMARARVALHAARTERDAARAALQASEAEKKCLSGKERKLELDLKRARDELGKLKKNESKEEWRKAEGPGRVGLEQQVKALTAMLLEQQHRQQQSRVVCHIARCTEKRKRDGQTEEFHKQVEKDQKSHQRIVELEQALDIQSAAVAKAIEEKEAAVNASAASARLLRVLEEGIQEDRIKGEASRKNGIENIDRALAQSRQRVWELEEAVGKYRRKAEVQLSGRLMFLTRELEVAKVRISELEKNALSSNGGDEDAEREKQKFECDMRWQEAENRATKADVAVLQLNYELNEAQREVARHKRRLRETLSGPEDLKLAVYGEKAKEDPRRNVKQTLQETAAEKAIRPVIGNEPESLQSGSIRKTSNFPSYSVAVKMRCLERRLREAEQRLKTAEQGKMALTVQSTELNEIRQRLNKREETLAQLRALIRAKDNALSRARGRCEDLEGTEQRLMEKVEGQQQRLVALEKELVCLRKLKCFCRMNCKIAVQASCRNPLSVTAS